MISIDTAFLQQCAATAQSANDAVERAVTALNNISVHNGWSCKEKTTINNYCISNKQKIKQLKENSSALYSAIGTISGKFIEEEKSIIGMFTSVETTIADILSETVANIENEKRISRLTEIAKKVLNAKNHTGNKWDNWGVATFPEVISIVADIDNITAIK